MLPLPASLLQVISGFISLEFLPIPFTMFFRDPKFSSRSWGLSSVDGTPIPLT